MSMGSNHIVSIDSVSTNSHANWVILSRLCPRDELITREMKSWIRTKNFKQFYGLAHENTSHKTFYTV